MKYYYTDFFCWEQVLIDALRKKGYFVYGVRDCEDLFSIEDRVIVNNVGFLVTDTKLNTPILDIELGTIGEEDITIYDRIKAVASSIKEDLDLAKAKYDLEEKEREKKWEEVFKIQKNRMERDRHYNLSCREDNPVKLPNGYGITFQSIYNNGDGTQNVLFFITDARGKIVVRSKEETFNLNARYSRMVKVIATKHCIAV
ncbi:hypothetical protein [Butyrivibrio sp. M55]|uniref:hypothetical protein n=1 Tax=Butyrivibrio sp. M55 TaxID=1855323 RepID=UPI0008EA7187|nr:hypothetical protein [Butyrivibrio sp. M55]SFU91252.1 hypothetical protein SAMN05216540_12050 [Butyrivibrio sp. M55]